MLKGIGIDIVEIGRIARMIETYGDVFLCKVFTEKEIAWCNAKAVPHNHFAGRWAAKEAFYKALPQSCQPHSFWKSIEIMPVEHGNKPAITICTEELKKALEYEAAQTIHVSISHEKSICTAIVIIE